jgi:hypothetical protein
LNEVGIVYEWNAGFTRKRRGERPARLLAGKPPMPQRASLAGRPGMCLTCH